MVIYLESTAGKSEVSCSISIAEKITAEFKSGTDTDSMSSNLRLSDNLD